jgi:hypothetical protein
MTTAGRGSCRAPICHGREGIPTCDCGAQLCSKRRWQVRSLRSMHASGYTFCEKRSRLASVSIALTSRQEVTCWRRWSSAPLYKRTSTHNLGQYFTLRLTNLALGCRMGLESEARHEQNTSNPTSK